MPKFLKGDDCTPLTPGSDGPEMHHCCIVQTPTTEVFVYPNNRGDKKSEIIFFLLDDGCCTILHVRSLKWLLGR